MESLVGKVLFASPALQDPNFARTAVLVVQHGVVGEAGTAEETPLWTPDDAGVPGAVGLVLNRGSGARVADVLAEAEDENGGPPLDCGVDAELFHGGPCDGPLMVLHGGPDVRGSETRVMEGVVFSSDREAIEPVLAGDVGPARFFAGYAGWGPGQLETELQVGAWVVGTLAAGVLFDADFNPWENLLGATLPHPLLGGVNPAILPEDPSLN